MLRKMMPMMHHDPILYENIMQIMQIHQKHCKTHGFSEILHVNVRKT